MTNQFFVREIPLPFEVRGVTVPNDDGTFSVYINSRLTDEQKKDALEHEEAHIELDHFYRSEENVHDLEKEAERYVSAKRRTMDGHTSTQRETT